MCKIFLSSISFNCIFCCSILKIFPRTIFKFPRHSKVLQFYNAGKNIYLLTIKIKGKQKDFFFLLCTLFMLPGWCSGKGSACQWGDMPMSKRCIFNPWIKKIPWRRKWQPTPIFFFFFFFSVHRFLFLFIYFFFTLQYCIGFAIHQHASATGVTCSPSWTPLPPPSAYHPSGASQCTSPKLPVSCILA